MWRIKGASKFGNRHVKIDGWTFDSQAEAARYQELKLLVHAGQIKTMNVHPRFELVAGITYEADFSYEEKGQTVAEDVKGFETDVFKVKRKLFEHFYPNVALRVLKV